ncbi:hypothetical protein VN12_17285 [Pirellula sp. SH-Sr6A]|uniref:hypothetical protein n=1 Tax=Pirellula sp. SH-Sr6A TaxID=1632865 RepID=UPI00078D3503|nr:hypothetical protein [Pirellula sp. SH-Sr6A]AMV33886.1 hypothetical protein VN12_17285 [Pirellula sp. SH-Sr6A]
MSDHWNSLANMLGTPSLSPQSKKSERARGTTESPSKGVTPPIEQVAPAPVPVPVEELPVSGKAKEPSRLRSSWDAVTSFFGIQSGESAPATESTPEEKPLATERPSRSRQEAANKRSKPSLWADTPDLASAEPAPRERDRDRDRAAPAPALDRTLEPDAVEEPVVSFGEPKRLRKGANRRDAGRRDDDVRAESESDNRDSAPAASERAPRGSGDRTRPERSRSDRSGSDRERAPRRHDIASDASPAMDAPKRTRNRSESLDDENGVPERRSERRPPRRGRTDSPAVVENEQTDEPLESTAPASSPRGRDAGRRERREPDTAARDSEPRRRSSRDDERRDAPSDRSRGRAPAAEREDGDSIEPARRRTRSRRDDAACEDEPVREREPAGFASGLDDFEQDDAPVSRRDRDDSRDSEDATGDERSPRKRRSRRRGKVDGKGEKSSRRDEDSTPEEDREAIEAVASHSKIPSWSDAIGGLVAANMENHSRGNHSHGRGRGRGGRPSH